MCSLLSFYLDVSIFGGCFYVVKCHLGQWLEYMVCTYMVGTYSRIGDLFYCFSFGIASLAESQLDSPSHGNKIK